MDFRHILDTPGLDVQYFTCMHQSTTAGATLEWQTWRKPSEAKMHFIICQAGGGAGGSPTYVAPNTSCFGGGGGGSGGLATLLIPSFFIPDILWLQAGSGGNGSNTGAGGSGQSNYLSVEPFSSSAGNSHAWSIMQVTGGGGGSVVGGGGGGGIVTQEQWAKKGHMLGITGHVAANGGGVGGVNNAVGFSSQWATAQSGVISLGGSGGGGQGGVGSGTSNTGNGGSIILPYNNDYWASSPQGGIGGNTTVNATSGQAGWVTEYFMLNMGGAGGGGSSGNAYGTAGAGGPGAPGAGGGGAGGATSAATRGQGGDGGDGFFYIISW